MQNPLHLAFAGLLGPVPRFQSDRLIQSCAGRCTVLAALPDAGPGALLSPQPPLCQMPGLAVRLLGNPPGFDRGQMRAVGTKIVSYFERHLLVPAPAQAKAPQVRHAAAQEPVGLGNRRLQIGLSGPFFTVFLPHSLAMGLQMRQKLSSLRPIFAFDAPSPTGS